MRYIEIIEARRNPDLNPKPTMREQLTPYIGRDDVFISFTDDVGAASHRKVDPNAKDANISGAKIGINPQSSFDTPIGIYAYPLAYVLEKDFRVPFAGGRPFMIVFEARDMSKVMNVNAYSNADLERDLKKLGGFAHLHNRAFSGAKDDIPAAKFWNLTRMIAREIADDENEEANYENYDDYEDDDDSWGYGKEKVVAIPSVKWNALLRGLGYDGVIDNGNGLIHENEPTQAVFFAKTAINELKVINRRFEGNAPKTDFQIWLSKPSILFTQVKKGSVPLERAAEFLKSHATFSSIKREDIPEKLKQYIAQNWKDFLSDKNDPFAHNFSALALVELPDNVIIEVLKREPQFARFLDKFTPRVVAHIMSDFKSFESFIGDLSLPEDAFMKLIASNPTLIDQIEDRNVTPEMLKLLLARNDTDERVWSLLKNYASRFSPELHLDFFQKMKKKGPHEIVHLLNGYLRRDYTEILLHLLKKTPKKTQEEWARNAPRGLLTPHLVDEITKIAPHLEKVLPRNAF